MIDPWAKLCRDRPCVRCGADDGTIVPAHANSLRLGKGMGLKAYPHTVIPLCHKCHLWLDNGPAERNVKEETYVACWTAHMLALISAGFVMPCLNAQHGTSKPRKAKHLERPVYVPSEKTSPHPGYRR